MTLVLSPKQARVLWAVLNFSAVKGAPMDEDCLTAEDMAAERLAEIDRPASDEEISAIIQQIWDSLDKKVRA